MARDASSDYPVRWWVPGDWNAFFGLFTNVILNVIVLTGLTLGVVKLPATSSLAGSSPRSGSRSLSATSTTPISPTSSPSASGGTA